MNFDRVKTHLKDNKKVYIACSITAIVTGAVVILVTRQVNVKQIADVKQFVAYKSPVSINQIQVVTAPTRRMHPGFLTQCKETKETTASVRSMAKLKSIPKHHLQQHLAGLRENVNGLHFEILGEASDTIADLAS